MVIQPYNKISHYRYSSDTQPTLRWINNITLPIRRIPLYHVEAGVLHHVIQEQSGGARTRNAKHIIQN